MLDVLDQPLHRCRQSAFLLLADGRDWVDRPVPLQAGSAQFLAELLQVHRGHVPFVGEDQHHRLLHVRVRDYALQLFGGEVDTLAVRTVDHVDQRLGLVEVVRPEVT